MRKIESLPFEEIRTMYLEGMGFYPIAKKFTSTYKTIRKILQIMRVPLRTKKEQSIITCKDPIRNQKISDHTKGRKLSEKNLINLTKINTKFIISKEFLYKEYIIKEKSCPDIAKIIGCNRATIQNKLHKYDIPTRITGINPHTQRSMDKIIEARARQTGENHPRLGCTNSKEQSVKWFNTMKLRGKLPIGENNPMWGRKRTPEMGEKANKTRIINGTTFVGEKNPNWMGGIMFEPYTKEFNKVFKEIIKQRDNFTCLKCHIYQDDHKKLHNRGLTTHHINYDKKLTIPENCCTLCDRCNAEVNFNRTHWTKFFQSLLSEMYVYKYSEDGKPIINIEVNNEI